MHVNEVLLSHRGNELKRNDTREMKKESNGFLYDGLKQRFTLDSLHLCNRDALKLLCKAAAVSTYWMHTH